MCELASPLPDDLALCHEIICQQAETIRESRRRIEQLEHQVELLHRRQFGPRRESVDPAQLRLFGEDASDEVAEETGEKFQDPEDAKPKRRWRRTGRQKLPEGLPRKRVEYELSAEELASIPFKWAQVTASCYLGFAENRGNQEAATR